MSEIAKENHRLDVDFWNAVKSDAEYRCKISVTFEQGNPIKNVTFDDFCGKTKELARENALNGLLGFCQKMKRYGKIHVCLTTKKETHQFEKDSFDVLVDAQYDSIAVC